MLTKQFLILVLLTNIFVVLHLSCTKPKVFSPVDEIKLTEDVSVTLDDFISMGLVTAAAPTYFLDDYLESNRPQVTDSEFFQIVAKFSVYGLKVEFLQKDFHLSFEYMTVDYFKEPIPDSVRQYADTERNRYHDSTGKTYSLVTSEGSDRENISNDFYDYLGTLVMEKSKWKKDSDFGTSVAVLSYDSTIETSMNTSWPPLSTQNCFESHYRIDSLVLVRDSVLVKECNYDKTGK